MNLQAIYRAVLAEGKFQIAGPDPGSPALECGLFSRRVERCRRFLADAGIGPGDALLFHGDQGATAAILFWATVLSGAVFVPVDAGWPDYLLRKACGRVQPRLVFVDDELLEVWQPLPLTKTVSRSTLEAALLGPGTLGLPGSGCQQGTEAPALPEVSLPSEAAAVYLFTSGSTGEPKAVVLSHAALASSARRVVTTFDWHVDERLLNLADPHTMSGLRNAFVAAPLAGMRWLPLPKRHRENTFALIDAIERMQPQRMVLAPVLLRQFNLLGPRLPDAVLAATRAIYCTGTDLSTEEVQRFHARFGIPVLNYYGLTETVGLCISQDFRDWSPDDASIGRPVGCDARLVDENGVEVAPGETGELQVRLEHPMSGYLGEPEATAALFEAGWLRTGDLCREDHGRISIVGRCGSFIKTLSTEKIQPQEIEMVLDQHPAVLESAVLGRADPAGGERIVALLVPRPGAAGLPEHALLSAFVRERLGPSRVPVQFLQVAALPRSANGKLLRKHLRDLL